MVAAGYNLATILAAVLTVYILVGVFATYYFLQAPKDWKEVAQARQEAVDVGTGSGNSTTEKGGLENMGDDTFDAEDSDRPKDKKKAKGKDGAKGGRKKGKKAKGKQKQAAKDFDNPVSNFDDETGD